MKIGDKVRITAKALELFPELTGKVLTVIDSTSDIYPHAARWGEEEDEWSFFLEAELELIEDKPKPETNEDLEWLLATARDAQWIFEHYAKLHSEKGTADGIYKSMFNLMIADRLADAIEANS